ncbi:RNA polymerase sigma factor [Engelhardtia mirabilis]|uniref:RNA polymerase sigma factor RpoE n=1 Tax=Engelhardtia mirabilis TaxID=2528011 RepID=A0A518BRB3_9BACT|nr:RNA polymerase sigma factor RpoE [Planctomycetes bacterium Pla133]QDV03841.1 RNA polymerase sigma factor RpoE [Planctomycetes bacterium Pla86]
MSSSSTTTESGARPGADPPAGEDDQLFAGVRDGRIDAWERFVVRFGPIVRAAARRAGLRGDAVDDAEQSTWTVLLRHASHIREPRSIPAWVITTATREAWRMGSLKAREHEVGQGRRADLGLPTTAAAADELPARLEQVQLVRDEVARLDGRCRALLTTLFLDPATPSYEEIASRLGIPAGSIGPTRQRCLARLALALERRGFDDDSF